MQLCISVHQVNAISELHNFIWGFLPFGELFILIVQNLNVSTDLYVSDLRIVI